MTSMWSAICLVLCALLFIGKVSAQDSKELNTSNMSRTLDAHSNGDAAEMMQLVNDAYHKLYLKHRKETYASEKEFEVAEKRRMGLPTT